MAFGKSYGMRVSGIYKIVNRENGKFYVGSSVQVEGRILKHLSQLRRGEHRNAHLQSAFKLYGEAAFEYDLIESCEREQLLAREQWHIDALRPEYNICQVAGNTLGYRHTPEGKAKMSTAPRRSKGMPGRPHTEETRKLLSQLASNRTLSAEHIARISEANRGNKHTAGHVLTGEHKAKVSAGLEAAWSESRSKEEAAARLRARWSDPVWKAKQLAKIMDAKAAKRVQRGVE